MIRLRIPLFIVAAFLAARLEGQAGEAPALGTNRIQQADIAGGNLSLQQIRKAGLKMFSTPFNKLDGFGDGPFDANSPTQPGHRPMLQNNGTFLRMNGLDAQTCMECHSVGSNATVPFTFAVGGVGGANNNAMFQPTQVDLIDIQGNGFAAFNGRFINPPFLFGSGGVELIGKEMTTELQALKAGAALNPGVPVALVTKGVSFGTIVYQNGAFDTSGVQGVDADLVVRPFGRKGEFPTVRAFDLAAMQFHMGMQPVEVVGQGLDADQDGVVDEILVGEISALHIFNTNLEPSKQKGSSQAIQTGQALFDTIGCTSCHRPHLDSVSPVLTYSFPEVPANPSANVFYSKNLKTDPTNFPHAQGGGIRVDFFSDLKRHDMGPGLRESFGTPLDSFFITARLWGIADTAPYLHDGRALTISDAILLHGGEALVARNNFAALSDPNKTLVLTFLRSLRTPRNPAKDILPHDE